MTGSFGDENFWDDRYREGDRVWSGDPNGALVDEVGDLPPGRALDLGSGEGDDARWLAARGWTVTAVDISGVAIERSQALGAPGDVTWLRWDVATDGPPPGTFDLVSMQYFPLPKDSTPTEPSPPTGNAPTTGVDGSASMRRILDAVAPGGTLLWVAHDMTDIRRHLGEGHESSHDVSGETAVDEHRWRGPDLETIHHTEDVAALLDDGWTVVTNELRARRHSGVGGGGHHVNDVVFRATRR